MTIWNYINKKWYVIRFIKRNVGKIGSYLRLFRLFETSLVVSTLILALLMLQVKDRTFYTTIFLALWLLGAGIASWNDVLDVKSDSISHPDRPIPSGNVTILQAKLIGSLTIFLGLLILLLTNTMVFQLALFIVIIGVTYSFTTKRFILLKNTVVTGSGLLTLYGLLWIFDKKLTNIYLGFLISIGFLLFSYEILKDIQDIDGDTKAGIKTIANTISPRFAAGLSITLFMLSCFTMAIIFRINDLEFESYLSLLTTFLIAIPGKKLFDHPTARYSEITRYTVISLIFTTLSIISVLQMRRIDFYVIF